MVTGTKKKKKKVLFQSLQTHLEFGAPVQASCQQLAGLDGYRRQLQLAFQNVSNGVDVGHIGLLLIVH